ncbi:MAG: bifunctional UDP-N-acetylglucosamine diphosphorylase/glucosamine-1-phosphate N-acetyltransferase GlmU [Actinomycetota bacterium]|nr:bifunctional UDP-N-acetylglucosamine diphosphorylase/glucosamine-1-phosphate N-acetyltransferase GlmU [Actinomycetota bacterium]
MSFTAVVMAAGQGTRMRSKLPKVLHPVCGRPMVHWPVLAAREAEAETVIVVGGADGVLEGRLPEGVLLAMQPVADGTGGAVRAALEHFEPSLPVVVLSGDVPLVSADVLRALVASHVGSGAAATMVTARLDDPSGYGRVVRDTTGGVLRVVETKTEGDATALELAICEVNTGIFCFEAGALERALEGVRADNSQGEYYLPDTLPALRAEGARIAAHPVDDPGIVLGVNDRVQLAEVQAVAQRRILGALMQAGVTVVDPGTTTVDAAVVVGMDTTIEPGSSLRGKTRVGEGCTVGPLTTLVDTELGDDVSIVHSYATEASAEDGVSVGPFAYLRPGTVVRAGARIGTFVEVKNSDIGPGTKVPHLSYIGDADIGAGSNLGAGTITANYDGRRKHRTTIGAGVKGSVHTSIVAPVTVGDGAWTAAGSVITEDIPPGALGVARARQRNVEDYAARSEPPTP